MATPTRQQARNHYARQSAIVTAAVLAVRRLFERNRPLPEIVATASAYQYASAAASMQAIASMSTSNPVPLGVPDAYLGVSSYGFPLAEPIIATIDAIVPAPAEALPANWWDDANEFMANIEQLIASEIADAGRTASQVEFVSRPDWQNYVRMLNPPSCARCAILAGRIYRDLEAFDRHPGCDCVMIPVENWQEAHDAGYVSSAQDAFDKGLIRTRVSKDSDEYRPGFSKADEQAIRDGADITTIVNATRGTSQPGITNALRTEVFGRKVKATTYGTTKRAAWRKANPTRLVRLRPESIYEHARDRDDAIRLLKLYGYIT
ncbi:VG15 protein [Aeromicrobium sp.]|uniref:VG15 protein n=1 Tax=Aeromicrobium sp. TaxID=1871063 RepID=UPI002FC6736F